MTQKRVLIVEDESLVRMHLREILVELGYVVVGEAADGATAIHLARTLRPDLVLLDVRLPQVDGLQVAAVLTTERIAPTLLLTAYTDQELVERSRKVGVSAYLVKPVQPASLMPAIEIAMARYAELVARDQELTELRAELETQKLVARAKGVLMRTQGLTEAEASDRLALIARNSDGSLQAAAEAILLANQLRT